MSIRVLVCDDSAFMRKLISSILNDQPDIEVVATARHGEDALRQLSKHTVDVVTLDVEMPVLNGLEALERIMEQHPVPVVMLSSVTQQGSDATVKALSLGAVDFVPKPSGAISLDLQTVSAELVRKVRAAKHARVRRIRRQSLPVGKTAVVSKAVDAKARDYRVVVAIGSSTGGPRALEDVIPKLPRTLRATIVVIQHMPSGFTRSFAQRLNTLSALSVKEAEDGDSLEAGMAYIAPGDYHMTVEDDRRIRLNQEPPVQFLRPSIDITMCTLPQVFGSRIVGVILTGMGRDGALGMAAIKEHGGRTIAQDRATSVIYSMPKVVNEEGHADYVLPITRIADTITKLVGTFYS